MGLIRNLLTVAGVIAVFGVLYLFIKPDWYEKLYSHPSAASPSVVRIASGTLSTVYSCERGVIEKEASDRGPMVLGDVVDGFGQGVPPKNSPYLLVVDKSSNLMHYWKLNPGVRKIEMKNSNSLSVHLRVQDPTNYSPSYQMEIWIDHPVPLYLDFEMGENEK